MRLEVCNVKLWFSKIMYAHVTPRSMKIRNSYYWESVYVIFPGGPLSTNDPGTFWIHEKYDKITCCTLITEC